MGRLLRISEAEWDVMQIVWRRGAAAAAEVIVDLADARDWNHRTIRTMLSRLVDKGALAVRRVEGRYLYRPAVTREKCVREASRSFLRRVFDGDVASLLVHFVSEEKISREELRRLKQALDENLDREGPK